MPKDVTSPIKERNLNQEVLCQLQGSDNASSSTPLKEGKSISLKDSKMLDQFQFHSQDLSRGSRRSKTLKVNLNVRKNLCEDLKSFKSKPLPSLKPLNMKPRSLKLKVNPVKEISNLRKNMPNK